MFFASSQTKPDSASRHKHMLLGVSRVPPPRDREDWEWGQLQRQVVNKHYGVRSIQIISILGSFSFSTTMMSFTLQISLNIPTNPNYEKNQTLIKSTEKRHSFMTKPN